jgi:hypothetical protein
LLLEAQKNNREVSIVAGSIFIENGSLLGFIARWLLFWVVLVIFMP